MAAIPRLRDRTSKRSVVQRVRETGKSVSLACGFEQEPRTALGFIDPNFDETCRCYVTIFVTHVVRFAETRGERLVVIQQLGKHVQWFDVFSIIIQHSLSTRDLSYRMKRE